MLGYRRRRTGGVRGIAVVLVLGACGRIGFERSSDRGRADDGGALDSGGPIAPPADARPAVPRDARTFLDAHLPTPPTDAGPSPSDASEDASPPEPLDASLADVAVPPVDAPGPVDASPPVDAAPPPGVVCEEIPPLAAAPTINGEIEPGLQLRRLVPVGWTGAVPIPVGHEAFYAVGYRPNGLYLFVSVVDTSLQPAPFGDWLHCGDAVELYVDADGLFPTSPDYDVPGTMQFVIAAPFEGGGASRRAQLWNNVTQFQRDWASTEFVAAPVLGGYAIEALVTAPDLDLPSWTPTAGSSVGLAIGVNLSAPVSDGSAACARLGQYFNRIDASDTGACGVGPFCTTTAFCVAPLLP